MREAERRLQELRDRCREMAASGLVLAAAAAPAAIFTARLGIAVGAGAAAAFALAIRARSRRRGLLSALLRERDAYRIEVVRHEGTRFASVDRRRRLGRWLRRIVSVTEGEERLPYGVVSLDDRVRAHRERLLRIADALETADRPVHPASVVLVHQLLTRPPTSPLYNPGLDDELLDFALTKVEAGVDREPD
jgi:hypothetical protein